MSFAGIDTLTEFIVAIVGLISAVKFLVLPLRRVVTIIEANRDLYEAQLRKNGGGSLTDKTDRIYNDVFPQEGPSMREMLTGITEQQRLTADLVNDQNKATIARLDAIESEQRKAAALVAEVKRKQEDAA